MGVTKQIVSEEPPEELPLLPCHVCKRTFLPQPLKKHVLICEQMSRKKRKRFDSLKQRVEGTDLAPFFQQSYLKKSNPENNAYQVADRVKKRQSNWKANHLDLMNTIRTAKGVSPDFNSNAAVTNRKLVHVAANKRCPICDRGFGPRAFDRHVEWCRENKVKTAKSPCPDQQAKERLEARLNYRVPPLKVPKKVIREKYSPINQAKHPSNAIVASKNTTSLGSSPMVNMPMNPKKLVNNFAEEQGGKSRFHRNIGDGGENKEVIKSNELNTRSFQTKRTIPTKKINNTTINSGLQGITVSSLTVGKDRKLVTWKDTLKLPLPCSQAVSSTNSNVIKKLAQSKLNVDNKNVKFRRGTLGKAVTDKVLMEKLNSFYQGIKLDQQKSSEEEELSDRDGRYLEQPNVETRLEALKIADDSDSFGRIKEECETDEELEPEDIKSEVSLDGETANDSEFVKAIHEPKESCATITVDTYDPSESEFSRTGGELVKLSDEMATHRMKVTDKREQLRFLELDRYIPIPKVLAETLPKKCDITTLEEFIPHQQDSKEEHKSGDDHNPNAASAETVLIEDVQDSSICGSARYSPCKKITFKITSRQTRIWKRRRKMTKCRMCIRCFMRNVRSHRDFGGYLKYHKEDDWSEEVTSEEENAEYLVDDSSHLSRTEPQISNAKVVSETATYINIGAKKSKSASDATRANSEEALQDEQVPADSILEDSIIKKGYATFRSLPNIPQERHRILELAAEEWIKENTANSSDNNKINAEDSVDSVVPKKKRKIGSVETNLKTNITKIKTLKSKQEELPLILDYEKIGLGSAADVLYVNDVFCSRLTSEKSEMQSGNERSTDGIRDFDDDLHSWETTDDFPKDIEERDLIRCESPLKFEQLTRKGHREVKTPENFNLSPIEVTLLDLDGRNSMKTLKSSSACTIVNLREDAKEVEELSPEIRKNSKLNGPNKIPCRLPRIIPVKRLSVVCPKEPAETRVKLPLISNNSKAQSTSLYMLDDKTIQVPSKIVNVGTASFSQQTSEQTIGNEQEPSSEKKRNGKITSTTNLHEPPDNKSTEDVKNNFIGQLENSGILNAVEPFSVDDELYQEYQKYEEMYLKERDRKTSSKRSKNKTADFGINIDDKVNKTCADSAYGSLNRKLHPKEAGSSKELEMEGKSSPGERMLKLPKFCHECGNKYPFDSVKFCVECGEKRLVL
ncbi:hypothetical protein HHI36_015850 [Cryptolaemus montrouzieri]|uniref:C2HC/C3H-type domain-containing protein n=1 Tax=Cryptolaemus montrouzieri TaxID=559131 RepID=A0ABD2N781_9CUCU